MRFNPFDDVILQSSTVSSVAIQSLTGSSAVNVSAASRESRGIMLNNQAASGAQGGRKRYLRLVLTPAFSGGSSPAILCYGQFIGAPGNGATLPFRVAVSNT